MKILNGNGGGMIAGTATTSRPYLREQCEGAVDVPLVQESPPERFPRRDGPSHK